MTREEAFKDFNRRRLAAQDAMRCDENLSSSDSKVGAELFSRVVFETGEIKPISEERLAEKLNLGARTVKRAIANLKKSGWIEISKVGRSNCYRPNFDCASRKKQGPDWPLSESQQGPDWPLSEPDRGQKVHEQGPKSAENRGQNGPLFPIKNPISVPAAGRTGAGGATPDGAAGPSFDLGPPGAKLRKQLGDEVFRSWFGKVALVSIVDGLLTLAAPTKYVASYIQAQFEQAVLDCWRSDGIERVDIVVGATRAPPAAARPEHPDARWLCDIGIELVAEQLGETRDRAAEEMTVWLRLCHDNPAVLKEILVGAARRDLHGYRFRGWVRQSARAAPQGQLKFGPEDRLKRRSAS